MARGAWQATDHGVAKSWTWHSDPHHHQGNGDLRNQTDVLVPFSPFTGDLALFSTLVADLACVQGSRISETLPHSVFLDAWSFSVAQIPILSGQNSLLPQSHLPGFETPATCQAGLVWCLLSVWAGCFWRLITDPHFPLAQPSPTASWQQPSFYCQDSVWPQAWWSLPATTQARIITHWDTGKSSRSFHVTVLERRMMESVVINCH